MPTESNSNGGQAAPLAERWNSQRLLLMTLVFTALLVLALAVPLPGEARDMYDFGSILHVAAFAILGGLVFLVVRRQAAVPVLAAIPICWIGLSLFGLATEWMQGIVGRDPSWLDAWANACGTGAGIVWVQARAMHPGLIGKGMRTAAIVFAIAGIAVPFAVAWSGCSS